MMVRGRGKLVVAALCLLLVNMVNAVQLRGNTGSLVELEAAVSALLEACDVGDLVCMGTELEQEVAKLGDNIGVLGTQLDPVQMTVDGFKGQQSKMSTLKDALFTVSLALSIASAIPYVGMPFKVASKVFNQLENPIKSLETGMTQVTNGIITPWETSIGKILSTAEEVTAMLEEATSLISGFGLLSASDTCIDPLLRTLAPPTAPVLDGLRAAAAVVVAKCKEFNAAMDAVLDALASQTWTTIKLAFSKFNVLDSLAGVVDNLKVVTSVLDATVTIDWISEPRFKTTVTMACPSGTEQSGLTCFDSCRAGYSGVDFLCWQSCPEGRKDVGAACTNPTYVPAVDWEHLRYDLPSLQYPLGQLHRWCDAGWNHIATVCVEQCRPGYTTENIIVQFCAAECPSGMERSIERNFCMKDSYPRGSKPMKCPSGYTEFLGLCYESCRAGETDAGFTCWTKAKKTLSVRSIASEVANLFKIMANVPGLKELEAGIKAVVNPVIDSAVKLLQSLNIPTPDDLPQIDANFVSVTDLPLGRLSAVLENPIPVEFSADKILSLPAALQSKVLELASKAGMPAGWKDCQTPECLVNLAGLPTVDMSLFQTALNNALPSLKAELQALGSTFNGCKTFREEKVDLPKEIANQLGLSASDIWGCDLTLPVCEELDFDEHALATFKTNLATLLLPLDEAINNIFSAGGGARLLEVGALGKTWGSDNFEMRILTIPLQSFLPFLTAGKGLHRAFGAGVGIFKADASLPLIDKYTSRWLKIMPVLSVELYFQKRDGVSWIGMAIQSGAEVSLQDKTLSPFQLIIETMKEAEEYVIALQPNLCTRNKLSDFRGGIMYELDTLSPCTEFVKHLENLNDPRRWTGVENGKILNFLDAHPESHPYWGTANGIKQARRISNSIHKYVRRARKHYILLNKSKFTPRWVAQSSRGLWNNAMATVKPFIGYSFPPYSTSPIQHLLAISADHSNGKGVTVQAQVHPRLEMDAAYLSGKNVHALQYTSWLFDQSRFSSRAHTSYSLSYSVRIWLNVRVYLNLPPNSSTPPTYGPLPDIPAPAPTRPPATLPPVTFPSAQPETPPPTFDVPTSPPTTQAAAPTWPPTLPPSIDPSFVGLYCGPVAGKCALDVTPICNMETFRCGADSDTVASCKTSGGAQWSKAGSCEKFPGRCGPKFYNNVCETEENPLCDPIEGVCGRSKDIQSACITNGGSSFSKSNSCAALRCGPSYHSLTCYDSKFPICNLVDGSCGNSASHKVGCLASGGAEFSLDRVCGVMRCGPKHGDLVCTEDAAPICNPISGWCGKLELQAAACESVGGDQYCKTGFCGYQKCGPKYGGLHCMFDNAPLCNLDTGECGLDDDAIAACKASNGAQFSRDGTCERVKCGEYMGNAVCSLTSKPFCDGINCVATSNHPTCELYGGKFSKFGSCTYSKCGPKYDNSICKDRANPICDAITGNCGTVEQNSAACTASGGEQYSFHERCVVHDCIESPCSVDTHPWCNFNTRLCGNTEADKKSCTSSRIAQRFSLYGTCSHFELAPIRTNYLIEDVSLGTNFRCTFAIQPVSTTSGWRQIFHVGRESNERSPGVWFYPDSTRLHVRVGTTENPNNGCDPPDSLPLNKMTQVAIEVLNGGIKVLLNGIPKCAEPNFGTILFPGTVPFIEGGSYGFESPNANIAGLRCESTLVPIRLNHKIRDVTLGTNFRCSFTIQPMSTTSGWRQIFHVGRTDSERNPGVWFYPDSTRLHVRVGTTENPNNGCDPPDSLPLNQRTHVAIEVLNGGIKVLLNGVPKCTDPNFGTILFPGTVPFIEGGGYGYESPNAMIAGLQCEPL